MNKIKGYINNLNYSWFDRIKKEFENNDLYDKKLGKIFHEEEGFDEDGKILIITIDNSIKEYCWNNHIHKSGYVRYLSEQNELCLCGFEVCRYIFEYIDGCLLETNTIKEKYELLSAFYKKIDALFSEFIEAIQADDYKDAIAFIKQMCLKEYFTKFQSFKDLNNLIVENTKKTNISTYTVNNSTSHDNFKLKKIGGDVASKIQNVLNLLKSFNYIDQSTNKTQLNRLFTGKIPEEKILWTGDIDVLKYFINLLEEKGKIHKLGRKKATF